MTDYTVTAADGKTVTISSHGDLDEMDRLLSQLHSLYGLSPDEVMDDIASNFTSSNLVFDIDPGQLFNLVMAYWTGFQAADRRKAAI